ncbi:VIT1/CCC1 transporter family protein [Anaerotruncus rubiinfantis]|jgi:VIT1/CCC1 family predicted Fe2+/Mn2+ transporter|uniref:VIT1/CCC1 transporter family protein n=1 Tax=Anaerotruncus rubiinfantis TaxID=1720200 RepID=UPI001899C995|nr:VIT1/CCC1 transporter family protein [Anaerotruncus rubiinfantis]
MGRNKEISAESLAFIKTMQQNELTESEIYKKIASRMKEGKNKETLLRLSSEELRHYEIWKTYSGLEMKPQKLKVWWHGLMASLLGFTFTLKMMENGEALAQVSYDKLAEEVPESVQIREQEDAHEQALMEMLDEERLRYVGSMVLGLNDALVELTGTLAGLTLAMQNTRIIALSGLITGISATLSMASSEFLSAKSEGRPDAFKSCIYTGIAYLLTVALLVLPYLIFPASQYLYALGTMLVIVVLIIALFNYYISVAKGLKFKSRFLEMACISLGVAALSFVVGLLVKNVLGVDI